MMKKAFYFMLKALFILELFTFGYIEKWVDKKAMVNFKIYDFTNWTTNDYNKHRLPDISRSKGNQAMKFGQLIEYNLGNVFLQNSCRK